MNLGDLLDELRNNILYDKADSVANTGADPTLWSDKTLVRYINQAQDRFAREAMVIRDNQTPKATQFQLVDGQKSYTLHKSVFGVLSAIKAGGSVNGNPDDLADLARAGHSAFNIYRGPDPYFFDPSALSLLPPGKPLAYGTDEGIDNNNQGSFGVMTFRAYPVPDATWAGDTISLRVVRYPINKLNCNLPEAYPEIPEEHHLEMLDWAAYLALRIVDVDAGMPERADEFRASFEDHVKRAKTNVMRKLFAPAQWGFGRNGFSWERD